MATIILAANPIVNTPLRIYLQPGVPNPGNLRAISGTADSLFTNCVPYALYYAGVYNYDMARANTQICIMHIRQGRMGFGLQDIENLANRYNNVIGVFYQFPRIGGVEVYANFEGIMNILNGRDIQYPHARLNNGEVTILACRREGQQNGHFVNVVRDMDGNIGIFDGHQIALGHNPLETFEGYIGRTGYSRFSVLFKITELPRMPMVAHNPQNLRMSNNLGGGKRNGKQTKKKNAIKKAHENKKRRGNRTLRK